MNWTGDVLRSNRTLLRRPGFLLLASATLSLGTAVMIGALTLVDAVLRKPPPWPNHAGVVVYGGRTEADPMRAASPRLYALVGRPSSVQSHGIARMPESVNVIFDGRRALLRAQRVDPGFLPTLGVRPAFGGPMPTQAGSAEVLVSDSLWRGWLEGGASVVGRSLLVDGQPMRIAGVLPADYRFFTDVDLLLPLAIPADSTDTAENFTAVALLARKPQAALFSGEVSGVVATHAGALRLVPKDLRWYGATLLATLVAPGASTTLWLCMACALLVLAVAGMNVSNLMMTRTLGRSHETALKIALGATGWRPRLPAFSDALVVGLLAAVIGTPMGILLVTVFRRFLPETWLTSAIPLEPDWRVLVVVALGTLLAALLAASGALASVRVDSLLRDRWATGGQSSAGRAARRGHAVLIVAQTALATVLLTLGVAAAMRWWRLEQVPLGFDRSQAMVMELRAGSRQYPALEDVLRLLRSVRAGASELPGVTSAGWTTQLPVGEGFVMPFLMPDGTTAHLQYALATPGALEAMGLRKIAGRWFDDDDGRHAAHVAVVNESYLAATRSRIGGTVHLASAWDRGARIVGVAGDTRREGATEPAQPTVFIPLAQVDEGAFAFMRQWGSLYAVLRGPGIAPATAYSFSRVVEDRAPSLALGPVRSLERLAQSASAAQRRDAVLLVTFAALATLLAAVGHYSVQAIDVAARRRAFALRGALGATPVNLMGVVVRRSLATALPGITMGLLAALGLRLWPEHGTPGPFDAWVVVTVVFLMTLTTLCAVAIPALRAAAVEPWHVLRND